MIGGDPLIYIYIESESPSTGLGGKIADWPWAKSCTSTAGCFPLLDSEADDDTHRDNGD